jgi:hypothetical protein
VKNPIGWSVKRRNDDSERLTTIINSNTPVGYPARRVVSCRRNPGAGTVPPSSHDGCVGVCA